MGTAMQSPFSFWRFICNDSGVEIQNSKFKIQNADLECSDSARVMPCATTHLESSARERVKTVVSSKPEHLILNFEF
jgi:hypothetical protein